MSNHTCPSTNVAATEQTDFLDGRWDAHEIGWLVAGVTAFITVIITIVSVMLHATNYTKPREQRQIIRILYMPAVYAVVSFFSYRFFRSYTYYELAVIVYEALTIMAFLLLLLTYIGESTSAQREALMEKDKQKIPIPFCCIRFRPTKPYFLHALKWSVLQYAAIRPLLSIIGIICQAYNVLCTEEYKWYFAEVYIEAVDFVSISVALYGLVVFYSLVKDRLKGRRPLAKFLSIKLIIFFVFYQSFVFNALASHGKIHATAYWTTTNIADGLNALCTCCEMVIFASLMMWSFNYKEYRLLRPDGSGRTSIWRPLWDSINFTDFVVEGWQGIRFGADFVRHKEGTRASDSKKVEHGFDIEEAFAQANDGSGHRESLSDRPMMQYSEGMASAQGMDYPPQSRHEPPQQQQQQRQQQYAYDLSQQTYQPPHQDQPSSSAPHPYSLRPAQSGSFAEQERSFVEDSRRQPQEAQRRPSQTDVAAVPSYATSRAAPVPNRSHPYAKSTQR